jgi:hypothetical protein
LGQVTVGLIVVMRFAVVPCCIKRRKVGTGVFGSSSALAGNPSKLISTTLRLALGA